MMMGMGCSLGDPPDIHSQIWLRAIQAFVAEMHVADDQRSASVTFNIPVLVPETIAEWMASWVAGDRPITPVEKLEVPVFEVTLADRPIVRSEIRSEIRGEDGELTRGRPGLVAHPREIPTSPQIDPAPVFTLRKPRKDKGQAKLAQKGKD